MQNRTFEFRLIPTNDDNRDARLCELLARALVRSLAPDPAVDFPPNKSVYTTMPIADGATR